MKREMVQVVLYEDGTYEVNEAESHHATQHMVGMSDKGRRELYYCHKDKWKYYLLKLLSTKEIDEKITELKKQKKAKEELKAKIKKELGL